MYLFMKKLYYLLYITAVILMTACTSEEKDLFENSSAERADAAVKSYTEILSGETNGWIMQYFPGKHQSFGGFNNIVKFTTDGKIIVANEFADATKTSTSLYTIKQSAGVVLSLDTYNDLFHVYSDPSDPLNAGDKGTGMEGDYDFQILEASAEKVVLQGKKSESIAVLTPLKGSWEDYLNAVANMNEAMYSKKYGITVNGVEVKAITSERILSLTYTENGVDKSLKVPFVVTDKGMKFYEPIEINGVSFSEFDYNIDNNSFSSAINGVSMVKIPPTLVEQFVGGDWFITKNNIGEFGSPYFAVAEQTLASTYPLKYAWLGSMNSSKGSFGLEIICGSYFGLMNFDYKFVDDDTITLLFNKDFEHGNGSYLYSNLNCNYMVHVFCNTEPRTFTITTDDPKKPSYLILTEDGNPTNTIKVVAAQLKYNS